MSLKQLDLWKSISTNDVIMNKELETRKDSFFVDSFTSQMSFGTAGIRGLMGVGTNKMNVHTIFIKRGNY